MPEHPKPPGSDLDSLRQRLTRLEREVAEARHTLTALEQREADRLQIATPHPPPTVANAASDYTSSRLLAPSVPATPSRPAHSGPPPLPPLLSAKASTASTGDFDPTRSAPRAARSTAERQAAHTAASSAAPRLPAHEPTPALRVWLERLQLWPPSGEAGSAEARLGAWWATRIGALLAVIGVVFFGVYVSLDTPPWVKLCQLVAIALGVCGLGTWLERRLPAFGAVVLASGLALGFFAAYAAHAVPALRVLETLAASLAWQGGVVGLIVGVALHRRSPLIATLAIGLGHVTAIFSGHGGFNGLALGVAALLGIVAVALRRARGWESPSVVAMPAGYAVYAMGIATAAPPGPEAALAFQPWPFLIGVAALYFTRDWRREPVATAMVSASERWFQNANASAAVLLSLVTALGWYRHALGEIYLGAAALLGVAAWLRTRQVQGGDTVAAVFTAKALAALTLGIVELADARTVALALLVQAWALAWSARRLESRVMAVGAGITAMLAACLFFNHSGNSTPIWSVAAGQAVVFLIGLVALAHTGGRWLMRTTEARHALDVAAALVGGVGVAWVTPHWTPPGWLPALTITWAALFVVLAAARRAPAAAGAAALLGGLAQVRLWLAAGAAPAHSINPVLEWNALAVLTPTVLAGAWLGRHPDARWRAGGTLAWALAVIGGALVLHASLPLALTLVVLAGGALGLGLLTPMMRERHLPWLGTLGLALAGWFAVSSPYSLTHHEPSSAATWATAAALLAWALPVALRALPNCDAVRRSEGQPETLERLLVLVATLLSVRAIGIGLHGEGALLGLAGLAAGLFVLALRPGVRPALAASWVLWLLCGLALWWVRPLSAWTSGATALLAWVPVWIWQHSPPRWKSELTGWRSFAPGVHCGLATFLGLSAVWNGASGADALWGLIGLVTIAGLTFRPGGAWAAKVAAGMIAVIMTAHAWGLIADRGAEGWSPGLAAVGAAAVALVALPLWLDPGTNRGWRLAGGGAALALVFYVWAGQRGPLAPFATVAWGGAAITLFMVGLFWRIAPYRLLGLLGLALCVPRVFIVDLQSVLHRILAFIVIGLVILWVGFSYHRFRHLVSSSDTPPPKS